MNQQRHEDHVALAEAWARIHPERPERLLYVSQPGDGTVRYVWTSGVQVGLFASTLHLLNLWVDDLTKGDTA